VQSSSAIPRACPSTPGRRRAASMSSSKERCRGHQAQVDAASAPFSARAEA
jgi:hypothetical protein